MKHESRKRYEEQLGVNISTAMARLKKNIFFSLVVQAGRDTCLRCKLPIETAEDLSVDHVKPWRKVSTELFWDIDNIAFSHRRCNTPDRTTRKVGPEGTFWCSCCKAFLSEAQFGADPRRWSGLSYICLQCGAKRQRQYSEKNPRFACPECKNPMRKVCSKCGHQLPMKDYMRMRRTEGVVY